MQTLALDDTATRKGTPLRQRGCRHGFSRKERLAASVGHEQQSAAYQKGVKEHMPEARITFDRFNVMQLAGVAQDEVRSKRHRDGEGATFMKRWPGNNAETSSPPIAFDDYPTAELPKDLIINVLVDAMQQARVDADNGFQNPLSVPDAVWAAYVELVAGVSRIM